MFLTVAKYLPEYAVLNPRPFNTSQHFRSCWW